MYKKILFGCVALLFAAATAFNIGLIQTKDAGDISLDAIAVMAEAQNEVNFNVTGYIKDKTLVVKTTTGTAQIQLCGDAAASYLGLVSGSISGCITVTITVTTETHDCPRPGYTC